MAWGGAAERGTIRGGTCPTDTGSRSSPVSSLDMDDRVSEASSSPYTQDHKVSKAFEKKAFL